MKTWAYVKYIDHGHNAGGGKPVVSFSKSLSERNSFFFLYFLWKPEWAELQWPATCISQQEPQSPPHVFLSSLHTTHSRTRKEKKKKKSNSPVTRDPGPHQATAACIWRRFKESLWLHYLPHLPVTSPPISGHSEASVPEPETDRASLIHSPPRCLCQVIAWRKKENRSIHLPWAWQVIFTWDEIWAAPAGWIS